MRTILLARAGTTACERGGDVVHVDLDEVALITPEKSDELIALYDALERLAEFDTQKSKIVEMRFFAALLLKRQPSIGHRPVL